MKLFEPLTIRGMRLRNRVVMPAMQVGVGLRGRKARAYYGERAKGGAGAIITAAVSVDVFIDDALWGGQPGAADAFVQSLGVLPQAIHEDGGKIGVQLWHSDRYPAGTGYTDDAKLEEYYQGASKVAPSAREGGFRALLVKEIQDIISRFARAAAQCQRAGFDFVELHGAHSYLLCQFFSPLTNQRQDRYGGSLEKRMRFGVECVKALRKAVGSNYPIFYRMGVIDTKPGGVTIEDSQAFAQELEKAGADCLDISLGILIHNEMCPTRRQPMGTFAPLAQAIKSAVKVPVIAVGRINTPEVAEAVLQDKKADLIAIGRQLIADSFWVRKVQDGRVKDIIQCDSCNINCLAVREPTRKLKLPPNASLCRHNPRSGKELEVPLNY